MLQRFKRRKRREASEYTNDQWLEALQEPVDEEAVAALREYLIRGLTIMLEKRVDAGVKALAKDHAQDALLKILDNLETFRGESKFTTWAHKIAVREVLTALRRKRWDNVAIADLQPNGHSNGFVPEALADAGQSPEADAAERLMIEQVHEVIQTALTDRQRKAILAVMVQEMPTKIVARQMGTNRNALYKLLYDARQNMKEALEARNLSLENLLSD